MDGDANHLTWALVIATYRREPILLRCLCLAAQQTRPPSELIVVDASPGWEKTRDEVLAGIATIHPEARWVYTAANKRSSAAQRNQGVQMSRADVVFLIDDDSLMYPDCAEHILRIYEADADRAVAGVNAVHVPVCPDEQAALAPSEHGTTKHYGFLARLVRRLLRADDVFVPYDIDFPRHPIPEPIKKLPIGTRPLMVGWGMTFRRDVCLREPFEEVLTHYAAGEDSDMGYRASRHGLLLTALEARLCHLGAGGGRLPPFVVAALGNLNPLVLHRLHSSDLVRSQQRSRRLLLRRTLILLAKDLSSRQFRLPAARGALFALRWLPYIFSLPESELRAWYGPFQQRLIDSHATPDRQRAALTANGGGSHVREA